MPASELDRYSEALLLREEALLGYVRLSSDLDLQCRVGANVANPVGVLTPGRAHDGAVRFGVVRQRHRNRVAALPGLPTRVRNQQEGVAEEPAPSPLIQRERQSKHGQCETSGLPTNSEQRFRPSISSQRRRHAFVTGCRMKSRPRPEQHAIRGNPVPSTGSRRRSRRSVAHGHAPPPPSTRRRRRGHESRHPLSYGDLRHSGSPRPA